MTNPFPYVTAPIGTPILCQPFLFSDSQMAVFFLSANAAALNTLLDTYINEPSGGTYEYRCLGIDGKAFVVMIMARMTVDVRNTDGKYFGQQPYNELSFWIPCHDRKALLHGKFSPALYLPFLFPDSLPPIATGREMFGFAKQLATYTFPSGTFDMRHPALTATTDAFQQIGKGHVSAPQTFLSIANAADMSMSLHGAIAQGIENAATEWATSKEAQDGVNKSFLGLNWTCSATGEKLDKCINHFLAEWPAIFLKQFPSIENARVAESKSITSAPFQLEKFFGGFPYLDGLKLRTFDLTFPKLASMPIVSQLGLATSSSTSSADVVSATGFWVHVDFSLETGETKKKINPPKQKIAVLGGGIGSLSAVYGILQDPDWQSKYDITLYQMGWRLGGKGASGRNREMADRIEEHGLHIWFGYYENAFRLIQACYRELGRPLNAPLATWDMAFKPHHTIVVEEYVPLQKWIPWALTFVPNGRVPGQGHVVNDHPVRLLGELHAVLTHMEDELVKLVKSLSKATLRALKPSRFIKPHVGPGNVFEKIFNTVSGAVDDVVEEVVDEFIEEPIEEEINKLLAKCNNMLAMLPKREDNFEALIPNLAQPLIQRWLDAVNELRALVNQLLAPFVEVIDSIRRLMVLVDLAFAVAKGILVDGVLLRGYNAINDQDFTAWLIKNGASKAAANSAIVRSFYDLYLAFPNGQNKIVGDGVAIGGNVSAGELLHSYVLVTLCYSGAIMWKMQAGMGDTVMTPIYQVLAQRGVKFEFFNKVTDLRLAPSAGKDLRIGEIDIDVQATVKPNIGTYNPLYDVKGLPCWPSAPLYEQLVQGKELRDKHIDLESSWNGWPAVAKKTLKLGQDFDQVILGISVAALPYITSELSTANPQWQAMLANASTSQTQAMQLWLNINLEETGWPLASPVLDAYAEPFNTWAVMDQTLDKENWPQSALPFNIAYFCNNRKDENPIPPFSDRTYPERARAQVKAQAKTWLETYTGNLWPFATQKNGVALDWSKLVDLENGVGAERLDGQYFRANIDPTERYVCNAANTNQYRLKANESGFVNLYLAGDWIDNGSLNLGNVESTVISGLQAARALTKYPIPIARS